MFSFTIHTFPSLILLLIFSLYTFINSLLKILILLFPNTDSSCTPNVLSYLSFKYTMFSAKSSIQMGHGILFISVFIISIVLINFFVSSTLLMTYIHSFYITAL